MFWKKKRGIFVHYGMWLMTAVDTRQWFGLSLITFVKWKFCNEDLRHCFALYFCVGLYFICCFSSIFSSAVYVIRLIDALQRLLNSAIIPSLSCLVSQDQTCKITKLYVHKQTKCLTKCIVINYERVTCPCFFTLYIKNTPLISWKDHINTSRWACSRHVFCLKITASKGYRPEIAKTSVTFLSCNLQNLVDVNKAQCLTRPNI